MKKIYAILIVLLFLILGLKGVLVIVRQVKEGNAAKSEQRNAPDTMTGKGLTVYYIASYPYAMKNRISNHNGCAYDLIQDILPEADFAEWNGTGPELLNHIQNDPSAAVLAHSLNPFPADMISTKEDAGFARLGIVAQRKLDWKYTGLASLEAVKLAYSSAAASLPFLREYHAKYRKPLLDSHSYLFDLYHLEKEHGCKAFIVDLDHFSWAINETSATLAEYYSPVYEIANPPYKLYFPAANGQAQQYADYVDQKLKNARQDGSYQRIMQFYFGKQRPTLRKIPSL